MYDTLIDLLQDAGRRERQIRFIDGEKDESTLSFMELADRSRRLLGVLQAQGMHPRDELVIFTRSNESFVIAFWAAILGGIVPVPVAVGISDEHRFKLFRILSQMKNGTLYTDSDLLDRLQKFAAEHARTEIGEMLETRSIVSAELEGGPGGELASPEPQDLAFIQYSSGSTSDPKGVCLTHRNLCANIRAIVEGLDFRDNDVSLSWMPLTHDMGLIGFHLSVLAAGMNHALMDTSLFVRRPLLWMSKASDLRATQLCSPNFGYKHFLKLFARKRLDDLELSCIKRVLNGAEPISWDLCVDFLDALAPFGLRRATMLPVYGLAEATVGVTIPALDQELSRIVVDRHALRIGAPCTPLEAGHPDSVSFVKVGVPIRDVELRITDDNDAALANGVVGNIQLRGASITSGLYGDAESGATLFSTDGWLRTGDVGVLVDGELAVTGRSKDIVIVNGQNYYPHDVEEAVATLAPLDLGKVAVAGVMSGSSGAEQLVVFVLFRQDLEAFVGLADQVRRVVGETIGIDVDHVVPVSRIPKTTSGKIQRAHLARDFADGNFDEVVAKLRARYEEHEVPGEGDDALIRDLVSICHEFAKERVVGPDDDLFEAGISSLALTEIMLAVDERYPGKVDISDLFDYPTIRELADFMRK